MTVRAPDLGVLVRPLPGLGNAYGPPGEGPFPAVLLLHGSEGPWSGHSDVMAAILAAHGYLALPFGYSMGGNFWNAGHIRDVPLDRTATALAALRSSPLCSGRVGLYGASRGAEHALLVTALMARDGLSGLPDAVAVHAAPDVVCGAFDAAQWRDEGDPGWQAWDPGQRAWTWNGASDDLLPTTPIPIERYAGAVYLSHGTEDRMWSAQMTRRLEERLRAHGRAPEVHHLAGQDHVPLGDDANAHHRRLLDFFGRTLSAP